MDFRQNTVDMHTTLSKAERQEQGIFMTPRTVRQRLWALLASLLNSNPTILEPSFGTGEFLQDMNPALTVIGVEKNPKLFASAAANKKPNQTLYNADFLTFQSDPVDLVVGNPPYFVTEDKDPACMKGRGNIFVQFIYKCLTQHLKPGGILAFVLPTSFYNCAYYEPCRKYMRDNTTILRLENIADADFYDTAQQTMIMIVRNTPCDQKPYFLQEPPTVLSPFYRELKELREGSSTLSALGFQVKTGDVVWNQHKEKLVAGSTDSVLVLYSGNIVGNEIVLNQTKVKGDKKQYIKGFARPPITGPAILVARGYGNTAYNLSFAYVGSETTFYGENHVNVITASSPEAATEFPRVLASLKSEKTSKFLSMYVGNGALSKTELHTVLPIWGVS